MKNYTIRLYTTVDTIIEMNIEAKNMLIAENIAYDNFANGGYEGSIVRVETSGRI